MLLQFSEVYIEVVLTKLFSQCSEIYNNILLDTVAVT